MVSLKLSLIFKSTSSMFIKLIASNWVNIWPVIIFLFYTKFSVYFLGSLFFLFNEGLKDRKAMLFKCTKCASCYKQKRTLDEHMKNGCGASFHCTLCKQNLATKCSLRYHLLGVHQIARRKLEKYGAGIKTFLVFK